MLIILDFVFLAESGINVLESLTQQTGVQFSSPVGFTGSLTRSESHGLRLTCTLAVIDTYWCLRLVSSLLKIEHATKLKIRIKLAYTCTLVFIAYIALFV